MVGLKIVVLLVACFSALALAWSSQDHEIFRLRDEVALHEGDNTTFYSFIGVKQSASVDDINKAYRKQSRVLHPDKARSNFINSYSQPKPSSKPKPGSKPTVHVHKNKQPSQKEVTAFTKEASARFSRLGVVANILRNPEERQRYDHFLNNGFPKWRGTGYYYQRFRPGLGTVLFGLFVFVGGGAHYLALYLGYKKQREFVERYIRHARRTAWGDESGYANIPGLEVNGNGRVTPPAQQDSSEQDEAVAWNRKEKRMRDRENRKANKNPKAAKAVQKAKTSGISTPIDAELTSGPVGAKKRTVAQNGKVLIVDSVGNVYLEEETEEGERHESLLDPEAIPIPTIYDTVLYRVPKFAYNQTLGRVLNKRTRDAEIADILDEQAEDSEAALHAAVSANPNGEARKRKLKTKR